MLKRFISIVLSIFLLFAFFGCDNSRSTDTLSDSDYRFAGYPDYPHPEYVPEERNFTYVEDYFSNIPYVGLYNAKTLEPLYTESADAKLYPASLTKMVTSSVAIKYGNLDDLYTVGSELDYVHPGSSLAGLRKGMQITLNQLLYALMLPSGNDAAYTIAVNVVRSIPGKENLGDKEALEYFYQLMNEFCAEIGAVNSHFCTPEGWDDDDQYTTVNDLAIIAAYVMHNDVLSQVVKTTEITFHLASGETITPHNSNGLIQSYSSYYNPNCIGIKTGTTDYAGCCIVACMTVEDSEYIIISANAPNSDLRFSSANQLYEFAKRYHYSSKSILPDKNGK